MKHRFKKSITQALKYNSIGIAIVIFALFLPSLESPELKNHPAMFYFEHDGPLNIHDVVKLPPDRWNTAHNKPWFQSIASTKSSWTKVHIGSSKNEGSIDLVAVNINPAHRNLQFYHIQDGLVLKSQNTISAGELSVSKRQSVFRFKAPAENDSDVYIRSDNITNHAPKPRILSYQEYRIEKKRVDLFMGWLIGASVAILFTNLITIFLLKQYLQSVVAIFFFSILIISFLISGTAENIFPELYGDINLFTLIATWAASVALTSALAILELDEDFSISKNRHLFRPIKQYAFFAITMMVTVTPLEPSTRVIFLIATIIILLGHHELVRANRQKADTHSVINFGYRAGFIPLIFSFLNWYGIIPATTVGIMYFHIGFLAGTFFFTSLVAIKGNQLSPSDSKIIENLVAQKPSDNTSLSASVDIPLFLPEEHQIVTMFVDIAAFSQISAPLPSDKVFEQLSDRLNTIGEIIREFGGSIDRSLGDGLLCFFGYRSEYSPAFNTQRAFLAARKIQESTIGRVLANDTNGSTNLIMPVRIGIHSSKMIIGNLGGSTRIDFTMIGEGVNFASRLETACTPFKVMFSEVCYRHLQELGYQDGDFSQVSIHIKHKANLINAYEFDPFRQRRQELVLAEKSYLKQLGIRMADQRLSVQNYGSLVLRSGGEEFIVRDFSSFGFRGVASKQFGRQSRLIVELQIENQFLKDQFAHRFVDKLTVEVRWSQRSLSDPTKYEHGFKIIGSSAEQRQFLFQILSQHYAVLKSTDPDTNSHEAA